MNSKIKNMINYVDEFKKKMEKLCVQYSCNYCFKIIFLNGIVWLKLSDNLKNVYLKNNIVSNNFILTKNDKYCFCIICANAIKQNKLTETFNNFSRIPECILILKGYQHYSKLALCTLYCDTFQKDHYSYWHMNGKVNLTKKKQEKIKGTYGMIYQNDIKEECHEMKNIREAMKWLKNNNSLYKECLANIEKLDSYVTEAYEGFPSTFNRSIKNYQNAIEIEPNNSSDNGLIINLDPKKNRQYVEKIDLTIGYSLQKDSHDNIQKVEVKANDDFIEPKIFPHLFPDGKGHFIKNKAVTLAQYFRNRLLHVDSRWRDDRYYIFYAYDRLTRERISSVNSLIKSRSKLAEEKNAGNILDNDYFEFGNCVPRSITGSKAYWKSKYYDLVSMVNKHGKFYVQFYL